MKSPVVKRSIRARRPQDQRQPRRGVLDRHEGGCRSAQHDTVGAGWRDRHQSAPGQFIICDPAVRARLLQEPWREVAYIAVDDAEKRDDRGLVRDDAVEIAHALSGLTLLKVRQLPHVVALPPNGELNVLADARYFFLLTPSA
jgi:hypothetical protein